MILLTTSEAADYLRLKERKLYELVAERQIPCSKITGKWLFPKDELDRWVVSGLSRPAGLGPAAAPPIVGGSQDTLLDWALRESRCGLASLAEGSEAGYRRFLAGELLATAIHFHAADSADANVALVSGEPSLMDAVLIGFATREQGWLLAKGRAREIAGTADVLRKRMRVVLRPEGAGARQLLDVELARAGSRLADLTIAEEEAPTGSDVGHAVKSGRADAGLATRSVAEAHGLDFVPVAVEHFDLLLRQRDYFRPAFQRLLDLIARPQFRDHAASLGGLDVAKAGQVRWSP